MARTSLFAPILVLLLSVITSSTLVPNHPEKGHHEVGESTDLDHNTFLRNSTEISKRSYGVPSIGGGIIPGVILAYPWPVTCPGKQWVRYCFKDQRSMEMLLTPLTAAILNWVPAMEGTAFKIQPDSACGGNYACLCSHVGRNGQTVNTDALVIRNGEQTSGDWQNRDRRNYCSLGYQHNNVRPLRHSCNIGRYNTDDPTSEDYWGTVSSMTHELGHAAGLAHEHQRPDRDSFIRVDYQNLLAYDEAAEKVATSNDPAFAGVADKHARMNLVVGSEELARKHWWAALDFMPGSQIAEYGHFQMTGPLDYDSIMMYPHFVGAKPGTRVITRLDGVNGGEVFAGGNPFPHLHRPSPGDVARIGVLYPLPHHLRPNPPIHPRSEADTIRNTTWSAPTPTEWKPLSVVIPGLVNTIIKPAPTFGPEEIAKAKKDYDGCSQCQTAIMNSDIIWPSEDDLQDTSEWNGHMKGSQTGFSEK